MQADAKSFIGFAAPLAIAYMTWSSVTSDVAALKPTALKAISVGQIGSAPKLPSAEQELRDPFTPEGAMSAALATAASGAGASAEEQPLHLDGTVIAGKLRFAIINGTRVIEGDYFRGLRLQKVETNQVVLTGGKQETILPLDIVKSDAIQLAARTAPGAIDEVAAPRASRADAASAPKAAGGTGRPMPPKIPAPKDAGAKRAER